MSDLFLLSAPQMARLAPYFPLAHGVPRLDDQRVVSGIVYVIRNGLQWKDAHRIRQRLVPLGIGRRGSSPAFLQVAAERHNPIRK